MVFISHVAHKQGSCHSGCLFPIHCQLECLNTGFVVRINFHGSVLSIFLVRRALLATRAPPLLRESSITARCFRRSPGGSVCRTHREKLDAHRCDALRHSSEVRERSRFVTLDAFPARGTWHPRSRDVRCARPCSILVRRVFLTARYFRRPPEWCSACRQCP